MRLEYVAGYIFFDTKRNICLKTHGAKERRITILETLYNKTVFYIYIILLVNLSSILYIRIRIINYVLAQIDFKATAP